MLSDKPKLIFSGYVNNNATDRMIADAINRNSVPIKPTKTTPDQQFQTALYLCGQSII